MFRPHVTFPRAPLHKCLLAMSTRVPAVISVDSHVLLHMALTRKPSLTHIAVKVLYSRVRRYVDL